jgi:hypothetical protein
MYRNETSITFQRDPPSTSLHGSSISQVFFLIPSEEKFFGCVFNQVCTAPNLDRIVTADETWVHRYEAESKAQSMAWKRPTSPVAKKFKSQPSVSKIILTIFLGYRICDFGSFHSVG